MPHLYKIGLENFRVFKDLAEIEFAPLTIFTGTNNSGKSSVIKAIQLLTNNLGNPDPDSDLILSFISGEHKMSSFNEVVNDPAKPLKFMLPTVLRGNEELLTITLSYVNNTNNDLGEGIISCIELHNAKGELIFKYDLTASAPKAFVDYKYFYKKLKDLIDVFSSKIVLTPNDVERKIGFYPFLGLKKYLVEDFLEGLSTEKKMTKASFEKPYLLDCRLLLMFLINDGTIDFILWNKNYSEIYFKETDKEQIIHLYLSEESGLSPEKIENLKKQIEIQFLNYLNTIEKGLHESSPFKSHFHIHIEQMILTYGRIEGMLLKSLVSMPGLSKGNLVDISCNGNNNNIHSKSALDFFLKEYISKNISNILKNTGKYFKTVHKLDSVRANTQRLYTYSSQGTEFNSLLLSALKTNMKNGPDGMAFLNKWLDKFGIKGELEISNSKPGIGMIVSIGGRPLADSGYGLTQLVPILLEIVLIGQNHHDLSNYDYNLTYPFTLIIEEPETNLHPRYQSLLAELFVDACKRFDMQIIIETHSEYIIRKLQYLTAKGFLTPADTSIYYFYHPDDRPDGEKQVKKIEIEKNGRLADSFGTGFFDEANNLADQLFLLNKNSLN